MSIQLDGNVFLYKGKLKKGKKVILIESKKSRSGPMGA